MLAIELATDAIHDHYRVRMPARSMPNTRGSTAALTACLQEQCECQEPESIGRSSGTSIGIQNGAAEIKIEAEARAGEMLAKMDKNLGGRPGGNRSHGVTSLADLGVDKMQSSRWQHIAKVKSNVRAISTSPRFGRPARSHRPVYSSWNAS